MVREFEDQALRAICDLLADSDEGLTGSEIGRLLADCGISDPLPGHTKRHRLYEALASRQKSDRCGNHVAAFIEKAMNPVRYLRAQHAFEERRAELNAALSFSGLSMRPDGRLEKATLAATIPEAVARAGKLRRSLQDRRVHGDVIRFCRAELLQDNYFHAVFEATKSVADKIRDLSGLTMDGAELVDQAFGFKKPGHPRVAFNAISSETEISEHRGLMNLIKGLFGTFRNVTAHAPKIHWAINEHDALDMLTLASLLHRRLDGAVRTNQAG
ncbi:MAG: TIGR02391 family protein [bacterium]|nr:TIGR02391 family protein [bacterium]